MCCKAAQCLLFRDRRPYVKSQNIMLCLINALNRANRIPKFRHEAPTITVPSLPHLMYLYRPATSKFCRFYPSPAARIFLLYHSCAYLSTHSKWAAQKNLKVLRRPQCAKTCVPNRHVPL
jgi:hypothetical protein